MLAFGGAIIVTTIALSIAAYLLVAASLSRESRDAALGQSRFNLLLAQTLLPEQPTDADYERLLDALAIRGGFATLIVAGDTTYQSGQVTSSLVSPELTAAVNPERLTYQETHLGPDKAIAVGTRVRVGGPALYFFYSQAQQQATLDRLRNVLAGVGLALAILGLVTGWAVARRLARPVAAAGEAAARVAGGDLSVRLPEGVDEFGVLGSSFNTMTTTLQARLSDLQAAQARERRFTADVAHELRTPVAALVGEASLLERALSSPISDALPAESRRAAALLVKDVGRLRRLIDDLLEISRIDARSADVQWETVDVADFLARIAAARRWPQEVTVAIPAQSTSYPLVLTTDRRRFERIVGNLVENALAHGRPPIVLEPRMVAPRGRAPQLVLSVTDHGLGIPSEHLPHLFERFYKADPSRRSPNPTTQDSAADAPGTGLGLSIAWENARLLGGTLRVWSNAGEGTRFTLRLPLEPGYGPNDTDEES